MVGQNRHEISSVPSVLLGSDSFQVDVPLLYDRRRQFLVWFLPKQFLSN
jgi:hypothetical protein